MVVIIIIIMLGYWSEHMHLEKSLQAYKLFMLGSPNIWNTKSIRQRYPNTWTGIKACVVALPNACIWLQMGISWNGLLWSGMRKCFNAAPVLETLSSWQSEEVWVSEPQSRVVWIGKATSLLMDGAWRESMLPHIKPRVCLQDVMREDIYCHCLRRAGCLIKLIAASFAHFPSPFTHVGSLALALWYSLSPTEKYLPSNPLFLVPLSFSLVTFSCHSISHLLLTFYLFLHCPQLSLSVSLSLSVFFDWTAHHTTHPILCQMHNYSIVHLMGHWHK